MQPLSKTHCPTNISISKSSGASAKIVKSLAQTPANYNKTVIKANCPVCLLAKFNLI